MIAAICNGHFSVNRTGIRCVMFRTTTKIADCVNVILDDAFLIAMIFADFGHCQSHHLYVYASGSIVQ